MQVAPSLLGDGLMNFYRWHVNFDFPINLPGSFRVIRIYAAAKLHISLEHIFAEV
jgi:hypothetical protein